MAEIEEHEVFFPNPRSHYSNSHFCNKNNIFPSTKSKLPRHKERRKMGGKKKKEAEPGVGRGGDREGGSRKKKKGNKENHIEFKCYYINFKFAFKMNSKPLLSQFQQECKLDSPRVQDS